MKVFVYYNLHKKMFSVKALEGEHKNKVIAHKMLITLEGATPKVSEAGRQRVLKEKRKNVHAGIVGHWVAEEKDYNVPNPRGLVEKEITYNPYKYSSFVYKDNLNKFEKSPYVVMDAEDRKIYTYS